MRRKRGGRAQVVREPESMAMYKASIECQTTTSRWNARLLGKGKEHTC